MDEEERREVEDTDADTRDIEEREEEETDHRINEFRDLVNRIEDVNRNIDAMRNEILERFDALAGIAVESAGESLESLEDVESVDVDRDGDIDLITADWADWEKALNE